MILLVDAVLKEIAYRKENQNNSGFDLIQNCSSQILV